MNNVENLATKELLYKIADDLLILGHRNSEWTGLGPILEEDIAFSSMAQDKIGQSLAFYSLLHEMGEQEPDRVAFMRSAENFHNCKFVELPIGEYNFSLIRHFLYDHADLIRFTHLSKSSNGQISQIAKKLTGEIKYHVMHANSWINKLGNGSEESIKRLQTSLEEALPYALGIFEQSPYEDLIIEEHIFVGESTIKKIWVEEISKILTKTSLVTPEINLLSPVYGGRTGQHTHHLQPLLNEMSEVFKLDPTAEW